SAAPPSLSPEGTAKLAAARPVYESSLAQQPDASWHDETLRELALLIEELAERQAAAQRDRDTTSRPSSGSADSRDSRAPSGPRSPQLTPEQARAALVKARSEALPHWQRLVEQYPQSPRLPEAI